MRSRGKAQPWLATEGSEQEPGVSLMNRRAFRLAVPGLAAALAGFLGAGASAQRFDSPLPSRPVFAEAAVPARSAPGAGPATRQEPTYRTATKTVSLYVTVTDAAGRLVPDLVRDDFTIYQDGVPQGTTVFANEIQPIVIVMLLDRSSSVALEYRHVQGAAEAFVGDLLPADKARIGSFSQDIKVDPADFTSDHAELLRILREELLPLGPTPLWHAIDVGMAALVHQKGRRVVLVFTDGYNEPGPGESERFTLKDVMDRARVEDVMVYGVGLRGRNPPRMAGGGFGGGWGGFGGFGGQYNRATEQNPDPGLAKIASESGGGYFELTSTADLTSTFARVADELHHQYVLGFSPARLDGKVHRLEVRLKPAGMTARSRKSYVASPDGGDNRPSKK
jgi:Ca-activated chloride channel family protein